MPYDVFISYSRDDAARIAPIVALVRAMKDDLVFQDIRDLQPGKPWEPQLLAALREARTVIVFWCVHAAASDYVRTEYELAIEEGKNVLPLMLDDTDLPAPLAAYQGIDLRSADFHTRWRSLEHRRGNVHFYPRDERGEYVDGILRWEQEDFERREKTMQEQVARAIADRL